MSRRGYRPSDRGRGGPEWLPRMREPTTYPATFLRLFGLGLVFGGLAAASIVIVGSLPWAALAWLGLLSWPVVLAAAFTLAFLGTLDAMNVAYYLEIRVVADREPGEVAADATGEVLSSTLVRFTLVYIAVVVGISTILVTLTPAGDVAPLLAGGLVAADYLLLGRFTWSPAAVATVGVGRLVATLVAIEVPAVDELLVAEVQQVGN